VQAITDEMAALAASGSLPFQGAAVGLAPAPAGVVAR
jgi:hypothetical protein